MVGAVDAQLDGGEVRVEQRAVVHAGIGESVVVARGAGPCDVDHPAVHQPGDQLEQAAVELGERGGVDLRDGVEQRLVGRAQLVGDGRACRGERYDGAPAVRREMSATG